MAMMAAMSISTVGLASCASEPQAETVTCHDIVREAAFEIDVEDEIRGLDDAILQCGSYDEFYAEMTSYDRIVGYSVDEFIERRCRDESDRLGDSGVCTVAVPPTTAPELSKDLSYSGETLDGEVITVTPAEVPFDGELPATIAKTVKAAEQGCVNVLGARNDYAFYANDTREGKIYSMYAQHAQNVADFLGCISEPLVRPTVPPAVPATTQP